VVGSGRGCGLCTETVFARINKDKFPEAMPVHWTSEVKEGLPR
jgi:hypothetical protein